MFFLGFNHYYSKSSKGKFRVKRKTSGKKFKLNVKAFKEWLKAERHQDVMELIKTIRAKLTGHHRYYGITDNSRALFVYKLL